MAYSCLALKKHAFNLSMNESDYTCRNLRRHKIRAIINDQEN